MASFVIVISAILVLMRGQTDTQTDAAERLTPATVVSVSDNHRFMYTFAFSVLTSTNLQTTGL